MAIEKSVHARGFGSERLIVRGRRFLELPVAAALRPRYNEYPERFPVNPAFPAPGKRGASRPKADQSAVTPPGGSGGGTFPESRDRYPSGAENLFPGQSPPGVYTPPMQLLPGFSFFTSPDLLAGTSRAIVAGHIPGPGWITHISYVSENVIPSGLLEIALVIKLSDDQDTSGGLNSSGDSLDIINSQSSNLLEPYNVKQDHFPNLPVPEGGKFLKFCMQNFSAANYDVYFIVDGVYVP